MRSFKEKGIDFTRIDNDINGNPRYVIHHLTISRDYKRSVILCKKIGGRQYHTAEYGGGIVFQSYNVSRLADMIHEIIDSANTEYPVQINSEHSVHDHLIGRSIVDVKIGASFFEIVLDNGKELTIQSKDVKSTKYQLNPDVIAYIDK